MILSLCSLENQGTHKDTVKEKCQVEIKSYRYKLEEQIRLLNSADPEGWDKYIALHESARGQGRAFCGKFGSVRGSRIVTNK